MILEGVFEKIHMKGTMERSIGLMSLVAGTAGQKPATMSDAADCARHAWKIARNVKIFGEFLRTLTSTIDDRLDPMPFDQAATLGSIHGGDTPCPFILNPQVMTDREWDVCRKMDEAGLMRLPVTIAFGNALAGKLFEEKKACRDAEARPHMRGDIKQRHLELSELCTTFLAAVINPLEARRIQAQDISYEFMRSVLPDAAKFGVVIQMHNDMTDLVKDMDAELASRMIAPNVMIAEVAERGGLDEYQDFISCRLRALPPNAHVNPNKFPRTVRRCWEDLKDEAISIAGGISDTVSRRGIIRMMQTLPGPYIPQR